MPPQGSISVAVGVARHRVDGQIAAPQVFVERDVRRVAHFEAAVAGTGLALGARERVFLVGFRVQEHREIAADLAEAGFQHLVGRRADDDPVALGDRPAEQLVANRASDQIDFHRPMLRDSLVVPDPAARGRDWPVSRCPAAITCTSPSGQLEMNRRRAPIEDVMARAGYERDAPPSPRLRESRARVRDDCARPARQWQLPELRGSRSALCDLESCSPRPNSPSAAALVFSDRRLRGLPRLFRQGTARPARRHGSRSAATTCTSARPSPTRRSGTCATRC